MPQLSTIFLLDFACSRMVDYVLPYPLPGGRLEGKEH